MDIMLYLAIFTIIQRLLELFYSISNEKKLIKKGAIVVKEANYILMVLFHISWCCYFLYKSYFIKISLSYYEYTFLIIYLTGQILRLLTISALKERWNTKIIYLPNANLIKKGILKYLSHPNYLGVTLEIISIPLLYKDFNAFAIFLIFHILIIYKRIKLEDYILQKYCS